MLARKNPNRKKRKSRKGKVKKNIIGDVVSAAKTVSSGYKEGGVTGALKSGVGVASERARANIRESQGPPRICPIGEHRGLDNRCYPNVPPLRSYLPSRIGGSPPYGGGGSAVSVPGTVSAPHERAFDTSLKSAAPAVVRGQGRVNADKMTIEGISFVSRQMAKTAKRRMRQKK